MNEQQYEQFKTEESSQKVVGIADLTDKTPRTLLYGYDTDRASFHVYIDPEDREIHVMHFVPAGLKGEVLVLKHSSGPTGGVSRNEAYIPNKRLYPESCDLEFCRLMRDADINLPFTTFDEKGLTRLERHNGFAAAIYSPEMPDAVDLQPQLTFGDVTFEDDRIVSDMLLQAAFDTRASFARTLHGAEERTLIGRHDIDKVQAKVVEYFKSMSPAGLKSLKTIFEDITDEAIQFGGYTRPDSNYYDRFGSRTFVVDYDFGASFRHVPGGIEYESDTVRALQGNYEGRPYFVVLNETRSDSMHVNLFGDATAFIENVIDQYKLVRVQQAQAATAN